MLWNSSISLHVFVCFTARLEGDAELMESLQFENGQLRKEVDSQQQQLEQCQQEIEESRTMLTQLEQLAQQVQQTYNSRPSSVSCLDTAYSCYPLMLTHD